MIKLYARVLVILAAVSACAAAVAGLPTPNRGKQLFLLIDGRSRDDRLVVAMDEPTRPVVQGWHRDYPIYDFIYATVKGMDSGCRVHFTRYVMGDDYLPRQEELDLAFPYAAQPRYRLFDYGYITGFYRHSVEDIDPHEFMPRKSSNQGEAGVSL